MDTQRLAQLATQLDTLSKQAAALQQELATVSKWTAEQLMPVISTNEIIPATPANPVETESSLREARFSFFALLTKYLSPSIFPMGKGLVKAKLPHSEPDPYALVQYRDDAFKAETYLLSKWPSGLYRNQETKSVQVLIKADTCWLLIDTSNAGQSDFALQDNVHAYYVNVDGEGVHVERRPLSNLTVVEIKEIGQMFESFFNDNASA